MLKLIILEPILGLSITEKYYVEHYNAWDDGWINDAGRHGEWLNDERHGLGNDVYLLDICVIIFRCFGISSYVTAQISA